MSRLLGLLALAGVLAGSLALLAGCGGSSKSAPLTKSQYVAQMKAIGTTLSESIGSLSGAASAKDAAGQLSQVQDDLRSAAKQLGDISPPAKVASAHERLTAAVSQFADDLDPVIEKLKDGNRNALKAVTSLKSFQGLQSSAEAITRAGYPISG